MSEFDRAPVGPAALKPARYFAASYAGEHVAGTEFVIGALFVSWGVGAGDVITGLLIGNTLAVLTWALICAPIATDTRLTLYAYLEKIAGPSFIKLFSIVNGVLFCILAGAMITVSASAIRILFDIPPQVSWYPTSIMFVFVALAVGAFVSFAAAKGFSFVARFAEVSAPWMILMFFVGAMAMFPLILASTQSVAAITGPTDLLQVAERSIWIDQGAGMTMWHVAALAWGCNVAFHGALGDMTILRFARKASYGWFSALGMFIGHFGAWMAAGIMGAGAALLLKTPLTQLDAGAVAFQALGPIGILAVVIAGWTTSNPTIYRAGLAFQSLNPNWSRERVTLIVGVLTTIIACFPFVFTKLLDFLGLMALIMAPIGGIIIAEHYLFKRIGLPRYWLAAKAASLNLPAILTWALAVGGAALLGFFFKVHVLFLFVPAWTIAFVAYPVLAAGLGAGRVDRAITKQLEDAELQRKATENAALNMPVSNEDTKQRSLAGVLRMVTFAALAVALGLGVWVLQSGDLVNFKNWVIYPTLVYFLAAIILVFGGAPTGGDGE